MLRVTVISQPSSLHRWPSLAIRGVECCFRCSKTTVCSISLWLQKTPNFDLSADGDDSESWCSFFFYFAKQLCFKARTSRCRWWRSIKVPTQCPAVRYSCHQERHFAVSATTPNTTRMPGQENNKNKKWKPNNNLTCRRILILLLFQQSP